MSYINTPVDIIAEDLLIAALGLPRSYEDTLLVCSTSAPMEELLEAGVTFRIVGDAAEEQLESVFRVVEGPSAYHDSTGVDSPWWTTTGDDPCVLDQYTQADLDTSAGKWNLVGPEEKDETIGDKRPSESWASFRLYLKRAKEEREVRVCRIFDWLRRQTSAKAIHNHWWKFRKHNSVGYRAFRQSGGDTTKLWLTKGQKDTLETYCKIRLRQLP